MYTNNKNQISLEEAYRRVHQPELLREEKEEHDKKKPCCDACAKGEDCDCDSDCECGCKDDIKEESLDMPSGFEDAVGDAQEIVKDGNNLGSELEEFLPIIFAGAAKELNASDREAELISSLLMRRLNVHDIKGRLSELHNQKESLSKSANLGMTDDINKMNSVVDQIIKKGTLEAINDIFNNDSTELDPATIFSSLEKFLTKRVQSRK